MKNVCLQDIVNVTRGQYHGDPALLSRPVSLVARDSREVKPGALFLAFLGERHDGHDFIPTARQNGSLAVLGENPDKAQGAPYIQVADCRAALGDIGRWYRGRFRGPVIGISGSVGKTTCKELIGAVLGQKYSVLTTEKNLNNELGVPLTVCRLDDSHEVAVIEMGISHFGEMSYLAAISRPDFAVLTNCGDAHLEALGDRRGVLRAKTEMMDFVPEQGLALLNADDPLLAAYQPPRGVQRLLYGTSDLAQVQARDITDDEAGCGCTINGCRLVCSANGRHLIYSMLPAYALGKQLGLSDAEIQAGVAGFSPLAGRGNVVSAPRCTIIDHSYNANPSSTRAALDALAQRKGRGLAILGDMYELGENSHRLHWETGAYAASVGARVIAVGRLGREVAAGAGAGSSWYATVEELLEALPQLVQEKDNVLVKASHTLGLSRVVSALEKLS